MKSGRARWVWIVLAFCVVLVVGLAAGFIIGRHTMSSSDAATAETGPGPRTGIDLTGAKGLPTSADIGWFSEPLYYPPPSPDREPGRALEVFATRTGDKVIAWLYETCGMPEGIVAPHHEPSTCGNARTTTATAGPTAP